MERPEELKILITGVLQTISLQVVDNVREMSTDAKVDAAKMIIAFAKDLDEYVKEFERLT
jgi:hypothetical protein